MGMDRANDVIVTVDGRDVISLKDWVTCMEEKVSPGQTIQIGVLRSGEIVTISLGPTVKA